MSALHHRKGAAAAPYIKRLLETACLIFLVAPLILGQQPTASSQHFNKDGLIFDYPAEWTIKDESTEQEQIISLERDQFNRMMIFSPRPAIRTPQEFVAARMNIVDPTINDFVRVAEAKGAKVER